MLGLWQVHAREVDYAREACLRFLQEGQVSARPEVHEAPQYGPALTALVEALEFALYEPGRPFPRNLRYMEAGLIHLCSMSGGDLGEGWVTCGTREVELSNGEVLIVPDGTSIGLLWEEALIFEGCPMRRAERGER